MHTLNRNRRDVVIVGGRVAGSAAALLLARLGHDVVVVDRGTGPPRRAESSITIELA